MEKITFSKRMEWAAMLIIAFVAAFGLSYSIAALLLGR